jgi:hypothetical protein
MPDRTARWYLGRRKRAATPGRRKRAAMAALRASAEHCWVTASPPSSGTPPFVLASTRPSRSVQRPKYPPSTCLNPKPDDVAVLCSQGPAVARPVDPLKSHQHPFDAVLASNKIRGHGSGTAACGAPARAHCDALPPCCADTHSPSPAPCSSLHGGLASGKGISHSHGARGGALVGL